MCLCVRVSGFNILRMLGDKATCVALQYFTFDIILSAKTKHVGNRSAVVGPHEMLMERHQVSLGRLKSKQRNEATTRESEWLTAQARRARESSEQRAR